ncbi:hypothetical protein FQZ97_451350 [compost metagenome]
MWAFELVNIPLSPRDAFALGALIPFVKPEHLGLPDGMATSGHAPHGCEYAVPSRFCEPLDDVTSIPFDRHDKSPSYQQLRIRRRQFNGHLIHPSTRRATAQLGDPSLETPSSWGWCLRRSEHVI